VRHNIKLDFSGTNKTKVHVLESRVADIWVEKVNAIFNPATVLLLTKHHHRQIYGATVTRDNWSFISSRRWFRDCFRILHNTFNSRRHIATNRVNHME